MDVRVTLEQAWATDPFGKEVPVTIRFGSTPAREIGAGGSLSIGSDLVSSDDLVDAGSFSDDVPRPQKRIIPGKRIEWALLFGSKEQNGLLVPIEAVMLWFGNWRYPKQANPNTPPDETFSYERNRVAMKWGWWQMPQMGPSGLSHLRRGEEGPDTTKIAPPAIPHVLIQSVDGRGQTTDTLSFRPWDWFRWQDDVVPTAPARAASAPHAMETFSVEQLRALADELEARTKKSQKA